MKLIVNWNLKIENYHKGFTLIEMVVVVGVVGMLMTAVLLVLSGTFRGKTRVETADRVEQNGTYILAELRKIALGADGFGITCPAGGVGESVTLTSYRDGGVTTLTCLEGDQIASESATAEVVDLVAEGIRLSNCAGFVSCDLGSDLEVLGLNFNFTLSLGDSGFGAGLVERDFRSKVVVRN